MKNLKWMMMALFAIVLSVGFAACSKNDDGTTPETASIVGTWQYDKDANETLIINSNGTGQFEEKKSDGKVKVESFKYTINGSSLIIDFGDGSPETYTFTVSGNKLTLVRGSRESTYTKK